MSGTTPPWPTPSRTASSSRPSRPASQIRIANTRAKLEKGVELGLMRGQSMAARSSLVGGAVAIGKTPLSLMPCAGTAGKVGVKSIASVPLAQGAELRGLTSRQFGVQSSRKATAYEFGRVGVAEFGQADLLIRNVVGKANVVRDPLWPQPQHQGHRGRQDRVPGPGAELRPGSEDHRDPGRRGHHEEHRASHAVRHQRDRAAGQAARRHRRRVGHQPRRGPDGHPQGQGRLTPTHVTRWRAPRGAPALHFAASA